jgi:hypothetical protein
MEIVKLIKETAGIDITKKCRKREVVEYKALACYVLRKENKSYIQIGKELNINHATAIYHCKNINTIFKSNKQIRQFYLSLTQSKETQEINITKQLEQKIIELENKIKLNQSDELLQRVSALLDNETFRSKLEAFVSINEKARYYPKFD